MSTERTLKTTLIVGNDALTKAITSIQKAGKKLDGMIQVAGLSILSHIEAHGDITQFEALWLAMPQGARKNALAEWAFKFGKLSANTDEASKKAKPFLFDRAKKTDMFGAEDMPWFTFKPEKAVDEEFDFQKMLAMLMSKADKAEAAGIPIKGAEQLKAVRAAAHTAPANGTAVEA